MKSCPCAVTLKGIPEISFTKSAVCAARKNSNEMASQLSSLTNSSPDEFLVAYATKDCTSVDRAVRGGGRCDYEKRTSLPGSISKSRVKESVVFGLMISSVNFTKTESSRKMAYLSIDSKSIAMKNGQGDSGSTRFPHF